MLSLRSAILSRIWYNVYGDYMDGILPIYKEAGMTSHDVVMRLRRILHMSKIGHSGTLDPNATGVLLVLVGRATKALPFLEDTDKEYIATMKLGVRTWSDDSSGEIMETKPVTPISDFPALLTQFIGKQKQLPPMVSSVKVNGKKLYEYARKKETVERPLREIEIYELECLDAASYRFRVACSGGTYIRSLCVDIAEKSGNLGCMDTLIRTRVGRFGLADCVRLAEVESGNIPLFPLTKALAHYPQIAYQPLSDIIQGKKIRISCEQDEIVVCSQNEVMAIYHREQDDLFRCIRGLW